MILHEAGVVEKEPERSKYRRRLMLGMLVHRDAAPFSFSGDCLRDCSRGLAYASAGVNAITINVAALI